MNNFNNSMKLFLDASNKKDDDYKHYNYLLKFLSKERVIRFNEILNKHYSKEISIKEKTMRLEIYLCSEVCKENLSEEIINISTILDSSDFKYLDDKGIKSIIQSIVNSLWVNDILEGSYNETVLF